MVCEDGAEKERVNADDAETQRAQRRERKEKPALQRRQPQTARTLKTAGCSTRLCDGAKFDG